jgi:hypothetical protein
MNIFRTCSQLRRKVLQSACFLSVGNGAMTAPRYWQRRDDVVHCSLRDETSDNIPHFSYPQGAMNFMAARWQLES